MNSQFDGLGILNNSQCKSSSISEEDLKNDLSRGDSIWESYEGLFSANKKNGIGYLMFSNGTLFLGEFENDCANGLGVFYFSNRSKCAGKWVKNKFVS